MSDPSYRMIPQEQQQQPPKERNDDDLLVVADEPSSCWENPSMTTTANASNTAKDSSNSRNPVQGTTTESKADNNEENSQDDDSPEEEDEPKNTNTNTNSKATTTTTSTDFLHSFRITRLLDPKEPWVLVENGSFLGYFDWVPEKFRVGPWSMAAIGYLTLFLYLTMVTVVYLASAASRPWWNRTDFVHDLEYPSLLSWKWWYHVVISLWMMYVNYLVLAGPLSIKAWATYTVQSWTLLWIRHVLCAILPFLTGSGGSSSWLYEWVLTLVESIRFPVLCSVTCTFVIWNGILFPYCYFWGLQGNPERQERFYQFAFSFRLVQLHVCNMFFGIIHFVWASPARPLEWIDFLLAGISMVGYMAWYLLVLDRLGIHFYPVFTPRVTWIVVPLWTLLIVAYLGTFQIWNSIFTNVIRMGETTTSSTCAATTTIMEPLS